MIDIRSELEKQGIKISRINELLIFEKDGKKKEIPIKDMEKYLLNNLVNWFSF